MTQLVELQDKLEQFNTKDIRVYAISYDPQTALKTFADNHEIAFQLLSDEDSAVIKRFGILNTLIAKEDSETHRASGRTFYGIPFPGVYVTDAKGVVTEKFFFRHYGTRASAGSILNSALGEVLIHDESPQADSANDQIKISAFLSDADLKLEYTSTLTVRMELADGLHIYGEPLPEGFFATNVEVAETAGIRAGTPVYPDTRPMELKGLEVTLHVFEGVVDVSMPITATAEVLNWNMRDKPESIDFDVAVRYQVCSDTVCFAPRSETLTLHVPLAELVSPNRARSR